jgi:ribonuclease-3
MGEELGCGDGGGEIHSPRDPRTLLQEVMQADGAGMPDYQVLGSDGPPHDPVWTVAVLQASEVIGTGSGRSKQEAARMAAEEAMSSLAAGEGRGAG